MKYHTKLAVVTTKGQLVFAILYISLTITVSIFSIFFFHLSIWDDKGQSSESHKDFLGGYRKKLHKNMWREIYIMTPKC